jgi:hypothetical protein
VINLSALYLSLKRLAEVLPLPQGDNDFAEIGAVPTESLQRIRLVSFLEERLLWWLDQAKLPTLGEKLVSGSLAQGDMFTYLGAVWGKGMTAAVMRLQDDKPLKIIPRLRIKLDPFIPGASLEMLLDPRNYTSASAADELSGQKRLFIVARLTDTSSPILKAQAYAVGHLYNEIRERHSAAEIFAPIESQMEVFLQQLTSFAKAAEVPAALVTMSHVNKLRDVPERLVKAAFAGIIGEPFVPLDWAGESSDLLSPRFLVMEKQMAAAFLFKGPARFRPLQVADLGKNGDQISRLFGEPADFFVLQHCHKVTAAVRHHMRAFATRVGRLRPFGILDGADTARILMAYNKLGFSPPRPRPAPGGGRRA